MDYFAGLDVSVKETSICIVDDTGKIVRDVRRGCGRRHRSHALEEERYWHLKNVGDLLQSAGPDAVGAFLIFLHLWKVRPSAAPNACWPIASIMRRIRTRLPTCWSMGFGAFFVATV